MNTKSIFYKTILVSAFIFWSFISKAQIWGSIDSLRIIPANPVIFDTVKIISYSHFPVSYCFQINSNINISGFDIIVDAYHGLGNLHAFCYSTDTILFLLGTNFDVGNYCVIYNLWDTSSLLDVDTICFSIITNTIQAHDYNFSFSFFPNPIDDYAEFTFSKIEANSIYQLELLNSDGKVIIRESITSNNYTFYRNQLPSGFYLCLIRKDGVIVERKKICLK